MEFVPDHVLHFSSTPACLLLVRLHTKVTQFSDQMPISGNITSRKMKAKPLATCVSYDKFSLTKRVTTTAHRHASNNLNIMLLVEGQVIMNQKLLENMENILNILS